MKHRVPESRRRKRDDVIVIEPLTFHWSEWLVWVRELTPRTQTASKSTTEHPGIAIARALGAWNNEVDTWLRGFDAKRQRDVVALLKAEVSMLWDLIDPGHPAVPKPQHGGYEFSEFRERYFQARPLAQATARCGFDHAQFALDELNRLCDYAEQKSWLP